MTLKTVKLQSFRGFPPGPPPGLCPGPVGGLSAPPKPPAVNVAPSARIARPPQNKNPSYGPDEQVRMFYRFVNEQVCMFYCFCP